MGCKPMACTTSGALEGKPANIVSTEKKKGAQRIFCSIYTSFERLSVPMISNVYL